MDTPSQCGCCDRREVLSGMHKLLYEDSFCYIVDSGTRRLGNDEYSRRVSLVIHRHIANPSQQVKREAYDTLHNFMWRNLGIHDFFITRTMNTYPWHYHIHAYVFPITHSFPVQSSSASSITV